MGDVMTFTAFSRVTVNTASQRKGQLRAELLEAVCMCGQSEQSRAYPEDMLHQGL